MAKHTLASSAQLDAWAVAEIRKLAEQSSGREVAEKLGVDPARISQIRSGRGPHVGGKVQTGLLMTLDISHDEMHKRAIEYALRHPESTRAPDELPRIVRDARYSNREAAAIYARAAGISDGAIHAVETEALQSSQDLHVDLWISKMRVKESELRTRGLAFGKGERRVRLEEEEPAREPIPKAKRK